jgi:hypothetical protein
MIILKANKVNLFVSSVLFVFWFHSPNVLDTPHICYIRRLRVKSVILPVDRESRAEGREETRDIVALYQLSSNSHRIDFLL